MKNKIVLMILIGSLLAILFACEEEEPVTEAPVTEYFRMVNEELDKGDIGNYINENLESVKVDTNKVKDTYYFNFDLIGNLNNKFKSLTDAEKNLDT